MKRNFRSLVILLLIAIAALGLFGALSSGVMAAGQDSNKQSRSARSRRDSTDDQSSKVTKKNRSCKQVCEDTYHACQHHAIDPLNPFGTDFGQPGSCSYVRWTCVQDCPSNQKQRKPQRLPKT
jgi:hypothetical protein